MKKYVKRNLFLFVLIVVVRVGPPFHRQPGHLLSWFDPETVPGKSMEDIFFSALIDASSPESAEAVGKEGPGGVKALVPGAGAQVLQEAHPRGTSGDDGRPGRDLFHLPECLFF
jgi:hypothetical protein